MASLYEKLPSTSEEEEEEEESQEQIKNGKKWKKCINKLQPRMKGRERGKH